MLSPLSLMLAFVAVMWLVGIAASGLAFVVGLCARRVGLFLCLAAVG